VRYVIRSRPGFFTFSSPDSFDGFGSSGLETCSVKEAVKSRIVC
jgi:hypothetical protein